MAQEAARDCQDRPRTHFQTTANCHHLVGQAVVVGVQEQVAPPYPDQYQKQTVGPRSFYPIWLSSPAMKGSIKREINPPR